MKAIQFILSIALTICAIVMLYNSVVTYSPMRGFSITLMSILFLLTLLLTRLTFKELWQQRTK